MWAGGKDGKGRVGEKLEAQYAKQDLIKRAPGQGQFASPERQETEKQ